MDRKKLLKELAARAKRGKHYLRIYDEMNGEQTLCGESEIDGDDDIIIHIGCNYVDDESNEIKNE